MKNEIIKVLDHGHVRYLDHMGDDGTIAMDARTSYDKRSPGKDRSLLRRLMRDRHTSPFEMAVLKVEMKMPIFVARQFVRHRTASMNEVSARYTELPDEVFRVRKDYPLQSKINKQGREGVSLGERERKDLNDTMDSAFDASRHAYENALSYGVSREIARTVLPVAQYTKFVWKMDLHNLFHFLGLRLDEHAQYECRVYAEAIWLMVQELFPVASDAFYDYQLHGISLSRFEHDMLTYLLHSHGLRKNNLAKLYHTYVGGGAMTETEWKKFVTVFLL